ncbi:30S ribosomal protein S17 [Candidatus Atribacteria bacterium 4572_76]|nr:MAG: 30S ribosomal protein S17 [Candidatus Atribacteria bacterium 4572_76]HCL90919.1 30S ribosomal protein S17 [Candidatus Atribacteria bacterium]
MLSGKKIKTKIGKVVSDSMEKSIVVKVEYLVSHPLYKKRIKKSTKFMAHDEKNICSIGDKVKIAETRPLSKRKRWRVTEILEKTK